MQRRFRGPGARLSALAADAALRELAGKAGGALAVKLGGGLLALAMTVAVARATSAEAFGLYAFGFNLAMLVSLAAGGGLATGILRWRPEHEARGEPALAASAERWGTAWSLAGAAAAFLGPAAAAGALALADAAGLGRPAAATPGTLLAAGALAAPMVFSSYAAGALRARGATLGALAPRDVGWRAAWAAVAGGAAAHGVSLSAEAALWSAAVLLTAATLAQAAWLGPWPGRIAAPPQARRGWAAQTRPLWGAALIGGAQRSLEVTLVGALLGPRAAGLYFAAATAAQALTLAWSAANMAAAPMIARAWHGGGTAALRALLAGVAAGVGAATLAGFTALTAFRAEALALFDPAYAEAGAVLTLLAGAAAVTGLAGPGPLVLALGGAERTHLRIVAATVGLTTAAQIALAPAFGPVGAATAALLGAAAAGLAARRACLVRFGGDPSVLGLRRAARGDPAPVGPERAAGLAGE
jgi:O-antigen/teichoic acid export membrane protein